MSSDIITMTAEELLKELIILKSVRDNLEKLMLHNANLMPCIENLDKDIKQITGRLFF
ncbi:hypothetical protein [Paenibacillus agricola]|uniref:Spo0E like sporulation regulatory protein n=1 Tax=Paenibacillus agricola TaxID=2716264 RepID=A0ABX0JD36_9BACL|nr:hypothetical protein [Paenibacillus agricola]NHN34334.1 hypothetical protein [Paenibacillus agricola]